MAFLDSAFDPSTYMPDNREDARRAAVLALRDPKADSKSEPIPDIAHGSIPGLLGVALSDQLAAARASADAKKNDLSAAPTRTDAPDAGASPMRPPNEMLRSLLGLDGAPAPPVAATAPPPGGPLMPVPQPPPPAQQPPPQAAGGGPAPALPSPTNVGLPPGAMGSATPPPMPPPVARSPAAIASNQPATATAAATAPPQDNSLIPKDSLIGRMLGGINNWRDQNRLTLLAMAGGLAGSQSLGQGLGRAFTAAVPAQQADIRQNQQNMTAQALIARGVPHDVAMAAATNPAILNQLLPQLFGAKQKQFTQIGEDMFGNKKYGFVDPVSGTIQPFEGSSPYGGGGSGGAAGGGNVNSNLTGDEYLKQFPPEIQSAVKAYVAGESMPTGNPRAGFTQAVKQIAQKYGQDVGTPADDNTYAARHKMVTGLASTTPGSVGGQLTYARTSLNHLADVSEAATDLNNSNGLGIAPLAHLWNNARGLTTDQAAKVGALADKAGHYGQEITKYYAGSPGGEAERTGFLEKLNGAKAPQELASILESELELARGKISKTQATIDETMGAGTKHQVMTPAEQKDIARVETSIAKLRGLPAPTTGAASAGGAAPAATPALVRQNGHTYQRQPDGSYKAVE